MRVLVVLACLLTSTVAEAQFIGGGSISGGGGGSSLASGGTVSGSLCIADNGAAAPCHSAGFLAIDSNTAAILNMFSHSASVGPSIDLARTNGTHASPTAAASGDILARIRFGGADNTTPTFRYTASIQALATQTFTDGANGGTKLIFSVAPNGSQNPGLALTLDQDRSATFASWVAATLAPSANAGTDQGYLLTLTAPADSSGTNVHSAIRVTPTIGNASAGTNTVHAGLTVDAVTGDAQVSLDAVNIGALTGTAATENAINVGSGWDLGINSSSPIAAPTGANNAPSYTFQGATDLGLYRISGSSMGFAVGGSGKLTFDTNGISGTQVTSGTGNYWRVPTSIANASITLPTCSTSANAGQLIYVDDSNDTARGMLCVCVAGTDDATYAWKDTADGTTACVDP